MSAGLAEGSEIHYRCRKCRTTLIGQRDLLLHDPVVVPGDVEQPGCSSHFVEKMGWMGDCSNLSGKLLCPKCKGRVGKYAWQGSKCSCGRWVAPAFQVLKSRVDSDKKYF